MSGAQQQTLIADPAAQVRKVLNKLRASKVLTGEELQVLEDALKPELQPPTHPRRFKDWPVIVGAWYSEYEQACGISCPRLTGTEGRMLKNAATRINNVSRCCELIKTFWTWRASLDWDVLPQPSTKGFLKNISRVAEYFGQQEQKRKRKEAKRREMERLEQQYG